LVTQYATDVFGGLLPYTHALRSERQASKVVEGPDKMIRDKMIKEGE
jgi:hypothetical protein